MVKDNVAMTSLAERKEQAEKFPSLQKVMDYWLNVRARTVFHGMFPVANVVRVWLFSSTVSFPTH